MGTVIAKLTNRTVEGSHLAMLIGIVAVREILTLSNTNMLGYLAEIHLAVEGGTVRKATTVGSLISIQSIKTLRDASVGRVHPK